MKDIQNCISDILFEIYGESSFSRRLAEVLTKKIKEDDFDSRGREHEIMLICWGWYPGGGTAQIAAKRIEEALDERL